MLILITTILISVCRSAFQLSFERWRHYHNALALTLLLLVLSHSLFARDDLKNVAVCTIWAVLITTALGSYLFHRVVRPRIEGTAYEVASVHQDGPDVWMIDLRRTDAQPIPAYAPIIGRGEADPSMRRSVAVKTNRIVFCFLLLRFLEQSRFLCRTYNRIAKRRGRRLSPNLLIAGSRPPSIRTLSGPFQVRCTFGFFIEALQS